MHLLDGTEIKKKKCPFFAPCGDPTAKEGCVGVGVAVGGGKKVSGAAHTGRGAPLNAWQNH